MILSTVALILIQGRIQVDRQVLGKLPGSLVGPMLCGPTGRHVVCAVHLPSGGWAALGDGHLIGSYDGEDPIVIIPESHRPGLDVKFSHDGRHYAFVGTRKGQQIPVIDGIERPAAQQIGEIALSPTGDSYAYVAKDSTKSRLIRDGKEVASNENYIGSLTYSPDGRQLAWITDIGHGYAQFLNGKQLTPREGDDPKAFQQIHRFRFSTDSKHYAYIQGADSDVRIVRDGRVEAIFKEISGGVVQDIDFTPDSKRLAVAFGGIWSTQVGFIRDGKVVPAGPASGTTQAGQFIWSPNSKHFATAVWRANKTYAVLDGQEMPEHVYAFSKPGWVLDDGRFAYCSSDLNSSVLWTTHFGGQDFKGWLLHDMTADGSHLAMCRSLQDRNVTPVQVDGRTYGPEGEHVRELAFSRPNAKHFYFRTESANVAKLYLDGVLQPFDGEVSFSPDERHVAVVGRDRASVDGTLVVTEGCSQPHLFWDNATAFHGYSIEGDQLVRIKGKVK